MGSCGIKKHIKQRRGKKSTLDEPASRGEEVGLLQDNESSNESDPELAVELRKEAGHAETSIVSAVPKAGGMGEDVQNQGQLGRANLYTTVPHISGQGNRNARPSLGVVAPVLTMLEPDTRLTISKAIANKIPASFKTYL